MHRISMAAGAALGILLTAAPGAITAQPYTSYRLKNIAVSDQCGDSPQCGQKNGLVRIDNLQVDPVNGNPRGGFVDITVSAERAAEWLRHTCPGHAQRFRFTWRFDQDASVIAKDRPLGIRLSIDGNEDACLQKNPFMYTSVTGGHALDGGGVAGGEGQTRYLFRDAGGHVNVPDRSFLVALPQYPDGAFTVSVTGFGGGEGTGFNLLIEYQYGANAGAPAGHTGTPPPVSTAATACGYTLGTIAYSKWLQLGGDRGILGCAVSNEGQATASPAGTSGRWAQFAGSLGAFIIVHSSGRYAGLAFETHGLIFRLYAKIGGTASWLGFPISDEHDIPGGRRSEFEGGYIDYTWGAAEAVAYRYAR